MKRLLANLALAAILSTSPFPLAALQLTGWDSTTHRRSAGTHGLHVVERTSYGGHHTWFARKYVIPPGSAETPRPLKAWPRVAAITETIQKADLI